MVCTYVMLGGEKRNVVCLGYGLKISRYIILLCVLLLKRLARFFLRGDYSLKPPIFCEH